MRFGVGCWSSRVLASDTLCRLSALRQRGFWYCSLAAQFLLNVYEVRTARGIWTVDFVETQPVSKNKVTGKSRIWRRTWNVVRPCDVKVCVLNSDRVTGCQNCIVILFLTVCQGRTPVQLVGFKKGQACYIFTSTTKQLRSKNWNPYDESKIWQENTRFVKTTPGAIRLERSKYSTN